MAWTERSQDHTRYSRTYEDGSQRHLSAGLCPLHYENGLDSGIFSQAINTTPQRVNNAQFDGWQVTVSDWHYALGRDLANHGSEDGWIGFGGRQGANWFKFRLLRAGYLHWPTRAWQGLQTAAGGDTIPDYSRTNLSRQTITRTIGPNDDIVNAESLATWSNIWTTPGGGTLSVRWRVNGDGLKEEVVINQAGREWIAANRPPLTPAVETYFGFVFRLDWAGIPKVLRNGSLQDIEGDFADDDAGLELKDSLDRLLAFMPLDNVYVGRQSQPLRKRFYKDLDGNHYLLVGCRVDQLNSLPAGDLIFDPTINAQVGASGNDGYINGSGTFNNNASFMELGGSDRRAFYYFTGISGLSGATIDSATIQIYGSGDSTEPTSVKTKIYADDAASPTAPTSTATYDGKTTTTAAVDWDTTSWSEPGFNTSPSIVSIIQELADSYDPTAIGILHKNDGTPAEHQYLDLVPYDGSTTNAPKLDITYTVAGGGNPWYAYAQQ